MPTNLSASETYRSKYGDAPKLNTTNYHAWSTALMYILRAAQAWRIVIGEEQPPEAPRNTASAIQDNRSQIMRWSLTSSPTFQSPGISSEPSYPISQRLSRR